MKEVRLNLTENEQIAREAIGTDSNYSSFNMKEKSIDSLIQKEKAAKFNNQVEEYMDKLESNNKEFKNSQDSVNYDINLAEIKPMLSRIIVKPFKQNPFQKLKVESGIIVDAGGYTPHAEFNPVSGKYEEQDEFIVTGCVMEVGPETKYLKEGDVVYYRKDTAVPVPFFKQGFISLDEKQVIAVVNEGLTNRFNQVR